MVVVDTSAIVAILEREVDAAYFEDTLEQAGALMMSAATFMELNAVMWHRRRRAGLAAIDALVVRTDMEIVPLTASQSYIAREAKAAFSALNFGDCFSYALAKDLAAPLLFKGNDFSQTDIVKA